MGENICKELTNKGLITKIYKEFMELSIKKTKQLNQNMSRKSKQVFAQRRQMAKKKKKKKEKCSTSLIIREMQIKATMRSSPRGSVVNESD